VLWFFLALTVPATTVALLYARREYRERGRLTPVGTLLLCTMLLVPNLILEFATRYRVPTTPLSFVGIALGVAGIALCVRAIIAFRSMRKVFCLDPGELATDGPYQWSRNPQYVGYFLFLVGFALTDWSLWCLAALLVVAASLHLLVLVEEEHLRRVFGERYLALHRDVPRYAGW